MSARRILFALGFALALAVGTLLILVTGRSGQPVQRALDARPAMEHADLPQGSEDAAANPQPEPHLGARAVVAPEPERAHDPRPGAANSATQVDAFVRGRLRSESGEWKDLEALLAGGVVIDLVAERDPRERRQAQLVPELEPDGRTALGFVFEDLEPGGWLLTVSSLEPEVWSPPAQRVEAPVEDLEIWCRDRVDRVRLVFRVFDRASGEPVANWAASSLRQTVSSDQGVLLHAGPLALDAFPVDGAVDWSLWAPGYAPAFGSQRDFAAGVEGEWTASVALEPGWGARIVALARGHQLVVVLAPGK